MKSARAWTTTPLADMPPSSRSSPIDSPVSASAAYRMETAQALVHKALIEIAERGVADTRVVGLRAEAA